MPPRTSARRAFAIVLATGVVLSGGVPGCGTETSVSTPPARIAPEVDRLAAWMVGRFDSSAQSAADPRYLDISLQACPVWPSRTDGRWIYVEQAPSDALDRPYRQRMYRVRFDGEGRLVSEVFAFPESLLPAPGSWRDPATLDAVEPSLLLPREGCAVYLTSRGDDFVGGTEGQGCRSTLAGADHATSEVVVSARRITSWDRGFAADGTQVWGPETGPYEFVRKP